MLGDSTGCYGCASLSAALSSPELLDGGLLVEGVLPILLSHHERIDMIRSPKKGCTVSHVWLTRYACGWRLTVPGEEKVLVQRTKEPGIRQQVTNEVLSSECVCSNVRESAQVTGADCQFACELMCR